MVDIGGSGLIGGIAIGESGLPFVAQDVPLGDARAGVPIPTFGGTQAPAPSRHWLIPLTVCAQRSDGQDHPGVAIQGRF